MSTTFTKAHYVPQTIARYTNNPLIEALPAIWSGDEAVRQMVWRPPTVDERVRELPAHLRMHEMMVLQQLVHPLRDYARLEAAISRTLRAGYVPRNPRSPRTIQYLHYTTMRGRDGIQPPWGFESTARGICISGLSGMGKTTLIRRIMSLYPQVIQHEGLTGEEPYQRQLVWLRVDCPHDGSLSGLGVQFFRAFHDALGTTIRLRPKESVERLLDSIKRAAASSFLGILVFDELQRLNLAKAGGANKMLNFFVELLDEIAIPIVFVGTYAASDLFANLMRNARRVTNDGYYDIRRPQETHPQWIEFIKSLWQYQWVQQPTKLDHRIAHTLYDLTQGVTDIVVKLFVLAQIRAIAEGKERITEKLLINVANEDLAPLIPAIAALRSNKRTALASFEDLMPPHDWFTEASSNLQGAQNDNREAADSQRVAPPSPPRIRRAPEPPDARDLRVLGKGRDPYQELKTRGHIADPFEFLS